MENNFFVKLHGLGNDYIVLDSGKIDFLLTDDIIKRICHPHFGIGSDGILLKVPSEKCDFGLRIYNPDASEAEKSGNGLRIFSKFIYDYGYTSKKSFSVETLGGVVNSLVLETKNERASLIKVDMGKAIFQSDKIPVNLSKEECIDELLQVNDKTYKINCVSVGNPHCVVIKENLDEAEIKKYGSLIENNKLFPNRINLQFVKILNPNEIEILIWERGAGYTLASGSSSCAASSVVIKKGLTNRKLKVHMPGGILKIEIDENWNIQMTGEVSEIARGYLSPELIY